MQGQETKKGEKPKYANPADCVVQILKEEGPGAFFLGIIPQVRDASGSTGPLVLLLDLGFGF